MKIAVVIPNYGLVGGAETFVCELCDRLVAHEGFQIHVFANKWHKANASIVFHKIPILIFPRFLRPISFAYFAQKKIQAGDYTLIHSHDRIFKMDIFTMHGIPHRTWIKEARCKTMSLFDRSVAWVESKGLKQNIPMVLPVSTLVKDQLLKIYDIPESKIRVVHPGISVDRFSLLDRAMCRHRIRERHGLSQSDIVVLFVGMNFEIKRLELVLEGLARAATQGSENSRFKLLVVGKGKKERYISMAREFGIADRVIFAGVTSYVEEYYLGSDIFAMPSVFDTFGIAVLEAMMAALPVIISSKVGAKDLIENGKQGFVLSENPSPSDITAAFACLTEREKRVRLGENGRQVALRHTWEQTATQVAELYFQLRKS